MHVPIVLRILATPLGLTPYTIPSRLYTYPHQIQTYYGWNVTNSSSHLTKSQISSTLNLMLNWGPIMYLPTVPWVMLGVSRGGKVLGFLVPTRSLETEDEHVVY